MNQAVLISLQNMKHTGHRLVCGCLTPAGLALSADFAMQNRLSGNVDFAMAKSTGSVAQVVRAHA